MCAQVGEFRPLDRRHVITLGLGFHSLKRLLTKPCLTLQTESENTNEVLEGNPVKRTIGASASFTIVKGTVPSRVRALLWWHVQRYQGAHCEGTVSIADVHWHHKYEPSNCFALSCHLELNEFPKSRGSYFRGTLILLPWAQLGTNEVYHNLLPTV